MRSKEDIAKLVAMMKENNWTQVKLAERLHVSQQVISRTITEKGTIKMSPMKVEMMYELIAKPYPASDIQI
jgi:DNA-binding transcriptional regulator LsrR (DeoR family)